MAFARALSPVGWLFSLSMIACGPTPQLGQEGATTTSDMGSSGPAPTSGAPATSTSGDLTSTGVVGSTGTTTAIASTTSLSTSSSTSSSTDEATFILEPDLPPEAVPCNPLDEMPCPEGQKCSAAISEWGSIILLSEPTCLPVLGDKQKGELCDLGADPVDGLDDCADTLCFIPPLGFGEPGEPGVCVAFCGTGYYPEESESSCADPNDFCFQGGCQECGLTLCLPTCDPLAPNCPEGQFCKFSLSLREQGFACEPPDGFLPTTGESCDGFYDCTAGNRCVPSDQVAAACGGMACCTPLCDLNAPNTCPGAAMGEACQPFFPAPFDPDDDPWGVQYNDLGYCALP